MGRTEEEEEERTMKENGDRVSLRILTVIIMMMGCKHPETQDLDDPGRCSEITRRWMFHADGPIDQPKHHDTHTGDDRSQAGFNVMSTSSIIIAVNSL